MFINFVKHKAVYIAISVIFILVGVGFMAYNAANGNGAFNYDVQFIGGTSIQADLGQEFENNDITAIIADTTGDTAPQVQKVGSGTSVAIKIKNIDDEQRMALNSAIAEKYGIEETDTGGKCDLQQRDAKKCGHLRSACLPCDAPLCKYTIQRV